MTATTTRPRTRTPGGQEINPATGEILVDLPAAFEDASDWLKQALHTTIQRGATLLTVDNYTVDPDPIYTGVYVVTSPVRFKKGESYVTRYKVDLNHGSGECECDMFRLSETRREGHGTCKHVIGVRNAVLNALRLAAPLLNLQAIPAALARELPKPAPTITTAPNRPSGWESDEQRANAYASDWD